LLLLLGLGYIGSSRLSVTMAFPVINKKVNQGNRIWCTWGTLVLAWFGAQKAKGQDHTAWERPSACIPPTSPHFTDIH